LGPETSAFEQPKTNHRHLSRAWGSLRELTRIVFES
jgi:hypothetical protein